MDLKDQLQQLFPDHQPESGGDNPQQSSPEFWLQEEPIVCKYEKRRGKPTTLLEGYNGSDKDLKKLAKALKTKFNTGGSIKNGQLIIQGDFRDVIMDFLEAKGFKTKRVGG